MDLQSLRPKCSAPRTFPGKSPSTSGSKAEFDELVRQMYDKSSPSFHHFLTMAQYQARYAPTAEDAATVRAFLASNNLKVTAVDQANHYITAQGRVADMQNAFKTQIRGLMR